MAMEFDITDLINTLRFYYI